MAHQRQWRYKLDRSEKRTNSSEYIERLASTEGRYSTNTDLERDPPRRRRWAAGYIDRPSCPSHAYISSSARSANLGYSSDMEYITQPRESEIDNIEAREQHFEYGPRHTTKPSKTRRSRHRSPLLSPSLWDQDQHHVVHEPYHGSDIEDLSANQHTDQYSTTSKSRDSGTKEGSDIVIVNRKDGGSDIASINSRRSSRSRSDRYSTRSFSMRSDVQDRKTGNGNSESDDEEGYISLDDYIAGRSDCVSKRSISGNEGEGSDAVSSDVEGDSDVGEGSDVAHGSDVASLSDDESLDDGDDCIEAGHSYRTPRWRC